MLLQQSLLHLQITVVTLHSDVVGAFVGYLVGCAVGAVGERVGLLVGAAVGAVGARVGYPVGTVGCFVGRCGLQVC